MPMREDDLRDADAFLTTEGFTWKNLGRSGKNWKKRIYSHNLTGLEVVLVDNLGFCFLLEGEVTEGANVRRGTPLRGGSLDGSKIGQGGGFRYDAVSLEDFKAAIREYLGTHAESKVPMAGEDAGLVEPSTLENAFRQFEEEIRIAQARTVDERRARIEAAEKQPTRRSVSTFVYSRNADVVVEVLERANGVCEKCHESAPFIRRSDGSPYLEVHHKVRLADGGMDTVENAIAVCANCHRHLHFG